MSRTPFIAGNWKMNKTIAEAEAFIAGAAAAGRRRPTASTSRSARRSLALQAMVDSARGSRVEVYAQNMHEADSGAFTGEVSAPMLTEIDVARRRARPLRAAPVLQRDRPRAAAEGAARRSRPGSMPILCVGETEEERERGDTERKLRHQVQEGLEKVADRAAAPRSSSPTSRSGRSAPAWSPRPSRRRRRSRSCARWSTTATRPPARRVRILYGGSLKPDNARRAAGAARRRRRAGRRREPRSGVVRAIVETPRAGRDDRPGGRARRPRRLGARAGRARATRSRSPTRRCSTSCGQRTRTRS